MKMHVLGGGRLQMKKSVFFPDADRKETIELPVASFLLRHPQGNILFDTGCHPDTAEKPDERWGGLAKLMKPISKPGDNVIEGLKALDLAATDIDALICSHLHPDHCGCNAFFTNATVLCHTAELAAARAEGAEKQGYLAIDWDYPMAFDELSGERDVFGDGRIVVLPLPGHTPGTIGAIVELERSGTFLLASDTVSMRANLDLDVIPKNTWNADVLVKSWAEIRHIEARGATVICGHDATQWESLKKGADAYE